MKTKNRIWNLNWVVAATGLFLAAQLHAQTVRYVGTLPGNGSLVKIDGTSSIHDWTVEGKMIGGSMEMDPAFDADFKTLKSTPKVLVKIPVRQLHDTTRQKGMDEVMYQAMSATNSPNIEYRLIELKPKDGGKFEATGSLSVAGVTKTNTMTFTFERMDNSNIKVSGSISMKMSDFNVRAPVLGVAGVSIKTGDEVKLSLDWVVKKAEAPK